MFAILDKKAASFRFPFFQSTSGLAVRTFTDGVNDKRSELYKYSDDFELYELAKFEEDTGVITPHSQPIMMGTATEYKKPDLRPDLFPEEENLNKK